ncbi:hypothetical protein UAW_01796 [Enterococcus haemoperoxidus ATCC BAA-382]|uniref:Uncharacterized protein n=1 Tax=Enterococcus haemoperoxidus ATCC BAA-382 TaxID=1158608 RepID=R2QNQ6_9ENTE|nr:hypothetical protein UAW_01796 [Enterococcus haemoperoxidus ATCC BAA-382]EOT60127.1 hypothetical protein I583_02762 [Enterococcus haemoperoxidus ATCC BAA-382]
MNGQIFKKRVIKVTMGYNKSDDKMGLIILNKSNTEVYFEID